MARKSSEILESVLAMKVGSMTWESPGMIQAVALVEIAEALTNIADFLSDARSEMIEARQEGK